MRGRREPESEPRPGRTRPGRGSGGPGGVFPHATGGSRGGRARADDHDRRAPNRRAQAGRYERHRLEELEPLGPAAPGVPGAPAPGRGRSRHRFGGPLLLAGAVLVVGSGFRLAAPALSPDDVPAGRALPPPTVAATPSVAEPSTAAALAVPPPVVPDPVRLRIAAIAVDAPVVGLGLTPQGAIDVPTKWGDVGWYQQGVAPGAVGPAVLVGHYDSKKGPAVFYRLRNLLPGDQIEVVGGSGTTAAFVVDRLETVSKAAFPAERVYGPVTRPEIRLITCDGGFDERTNHYLDNLVVYGHAVSPPPPAPASVPVPVPASVPAPASASVSVPAPAPAPASASVPAPGMVPASASVPAPASASASVPPPAGGGTAGPTPAPAAPAAPPPASVPAPASATAPRPIPA
ncbi:class F sortase [Frankia sp. CN7]|uniref:Class F sortase n=1 Tax=Frankia nepalensis TaxID=1836974 RepID=A0A937RCZ4_9ACTN|nr:class F sortase [Frankia nepalensis]MBL7502804.1 class F sortase [Frankia nepalensis]MBL7629841.1 class F sortase [Frankia nepalensis]